MTKTPDAQEAATPPAPMPDTTPLVERPWPSGHFYSPMPDTHALKAEPERSRVWPDAAPDMPGIDWRADAQLRLVTETLARQRHLSFPASPTADPTEFHTANGMFSALDAWALQAMLRHLQPARVIEIGCGWSSLVTARVNREERGGAIDVTCIEPHVPDFLRHGVPGIGRVVPVRVQDVPVERFDELRAGDVLFIDSSHVVKTGSDAQFLYHEVVPRLRQGVVVHVHDIFLPWDYPEDWVLTGRGWNEQYVLRSFLAFNHAFEVLLGTAWLSRIHPHAIRIANAGEYGPRRPGGGSLWMRRTER